MKKIKIALLSGGVSEEREVSLKTGEKIFQALDKNKYDVFRYDPKTELKKFIDDCLVKKFDLVFPALHGPFGEDGTLQGMLEMLQIPYVFSGCLASALAMNKFKTKKIVENFGVKTVQDLIVKEKQEYDLEKIVSNLNLPIVIKPTELGSSVGISIAKTKEELKKGIEEALVYGEVLLEEFVKGRELTVAVLGNENPKSLPVIEIKPNNSEWFDYNAKYEVGASEEICPAIILEKLKEEVQRQALIVFESIGCFDLARADFIYDDQNEKLYFLEINTIPGMTATSLAPQAAKEFGLEFPEFLDELIEMALERAKNK